MKIWEYLGNDDWITPKREPHATAFCIPWPHLITDLLVQHSTWVWLFQFFKHLHLIRTLLYIFTNKSRAHPKWVHWVMIIYIICMTSSRLIRLTSAKPGWIGHGASDFGASGHDIVCWNCRAFDTISFTNGLAEPAGSFAKAVAAANRVSSCRICRCNHPIILKTRTSRLSGCSNHQNWGDMSICGHLSHLGHGQDSCM